MDANKFIRNVIRPTLETMGMWSAESEKLLVMTACHESGGFKYREQVGGPALSYFQIEPATLEDVYGRYLARRLDLKAKVDLFKPGGMDALQALRENDAFACAIARVKYWMAPEGLPIVTDDAGFAYYAKKHWNTELGKATPEKYLADFKRWGPESPPEEWTL